MLFEMKLKLPHVEGEIDKDDYDFLQKISQSDLVGLIGGDWIKLWRWNNLVKIAGKVRSKCEELGVDPKVVSPKFLSQFFEDASLEEDETLQEMWANLLINRSMDPKTNYYYITILRNLEPQEAQLIQQLFSQSNNSIQTTFDFTKVLAANTANMTYEQLAVLVQKLYSFNILRPPMLENVAFGEYSPALETTQIFRFSEMGIDFCKNCTRVRST
jgi:hypothetical protein